MNLLQRIKDSASRVSEKAQNTVEINKLHGHISEIEREMEQEFAAMGKLFFDAYRSRDLSIAESKMVEHSRSCMKLQENIDELRTRIAELRNERLCACGHIAPLDANFCAKCGSKLEVIVQRPEPEPPKVRSFYAERGEEDEFYGEEELTEEEKELAKRIARPVHTAAPEEEDPEGYSAYKPADTERSRREAEEIERERERQLELDRRIRDWRGEDDTDADEAAPAAETAVRENVKCQICRADLPKGSMWCPRCGSEQI